MKTIIYIYKYFLFLLANKNINEDRIAVAIAKLDRYEIESILFLIRNNIEKRILTQDYSKEFLYWANLTLNLIFNLLQNGTGRK